MKIAVIGSGIAGNVAAWHLNREHDVTVFEAGDHAGGHTHTHDVVWGGRRYAIDTGFIVFNYRTYPNFTALLAQLDVAVQPSDMSFSVRCARSGLEYNGTNLNTLFARRSNLLRPSFYRMIADILRFHREAPALLDDVAGERPLEAVLRDGGYSREFAEHYLIPMGAAIWSTAPEYMYRFPARYFVRFLHNHGMLSVNDRPDWHVIRGGSREYVHRLVAPFRDRIRLRCPVQSISRDSDGVTLRPQRGPAERFDYVFVATHSDQALALLADPTRTEREVLGAIPYQENEAVLHTDSSLLPRRKRAWAAWNYHLGAPANGRAALTYNMNILKRLDAPVQFCVTLNNNGPIAPHTIIKRLTYHHPLYTPEGVAAQARQRELNGPRRTFYCGAYWRFGFHEDGMVSALDALSHFREHCRAHSHLPGTHKASPLSAA